MSGPDYSILTPVDQMRRAEWLAKICHEGQADKQGMPYIEHPMQVVEFLKHRRMPQFVEEMYVFEDGEGSVEPYYAQAAAWLHDTVEDTPLTLQDMMKFGFPMRVVTLVSLLTHRKDEHRRQYLARIRRDPTAVAIKLADQDHNTDPMRLDAVERMHGEDERLRLEDKYAVGYQVLGAKVLDGRPTLRQFSPEERSRRGKRGKVR